MFLNFLFFFWFKLFVLWNIWSKPRIQSVQPLPENDYNLQTNLLKDFFKYICQFRWVLKFERERIAAGNLSPFFFCSLRSVTLPNESTFVKTCIVHRILIKASNSAICCSKESLNDFSIFHILTVASKFYSSAPIEFSKLVFSSLQVNENALQHICLHK